MHEETTISFAISAQGARLGLIRALSGKLPRDVICPGHWSDALMRLYCGEGKRNTFQRLMLITQLIQEACAYVHLKGQPCRRIYTG